MSRLRRAFETVGMELVFVGLVLGGGTYLVLEVDDLFDSNLTHPEATEACRALDAAESALLTGLSPALVNGVGAEPTDPPTILEFGTAVSEQRSRLRTGMSMRHPAREVLLWLHELQPEVGELRRSTLGFLGRGDADPVTDPTVLRDALDAVEAGIAATETACREFSDYAPAEG